MGDLALSLIAKFGGTAPEMPIGAIMPVMKDVSGCPSPGASWQLCNGGPITAGPMSGQNTPDLTDSFLAGAATSWASGGASGGSNSINYSAALSGTAINIRTTFAAATTYNPAFTGQAFPSYYVRAHYHTEGANGSALSVASLGTTWRTLYTTTGSYLPLIQSSTSGTARYSCYAGLTGNTSAILRTDISHGHGISGTVGNVNGAVTGDADRICTSSGGSFGTAVGESRDNWFQNANYTPAGNTTISHSNRPQYFNAVFYIKIQ